MEKMFDTQRKNDKNVISEIQNESDALLEKFDTIFTILKSSEDVFTNELFKSKNIFITKLNNLLHEISQIKMSHDKKLDEIFKKMKPLKIVY